MELTIDREFADLCPALKPEERNLLEASLLENGCIDPIITWANHDDTILDGHNRYEFCGQNGIGFKTKALNLKTREDAIEWIISNQLGRRNLSDEQKAYLRGKRYQAEKKAVTNERGSNQHSKASRASDLVGGQNAHQPTTAAKLAAEYDVDEKTIRRDAEFAEAVDTLAKNAGREVKAEILSGKSGLTKKEVVEIAALPPKQQAKAVEAATSDDDTGTAPRNGAVKTDVDRLIEGIEKLIEKVNAMAASRMGHNDRSRAVVATLKEAVKQSKAMGRSWRNE